MREEFLYYIWQQRLVFGTELRLTTGERLEIIHPGYRNTESGPDFFNARIRIDGILWAGNVEIHTRTSDWFRHHHTGDLNYDNIILHAVEINDTEIRRQDGSLMPTFVMAGSYPSSYLERYRDLTEGLSEKLACSKFIGGISPIIREQVLGRMLTSRLESKFADLDILYQQADKRWPVSFYLLLARSFGFKTNSTPFELLARSLPWEAMMRHREIQEDLEAMLLGQAGLLPAVISDPYAERLKRQYRFFRHKYHLQPLSPHLWKFGGLRPVNFPTLRITQFAALHNHHELLLDRIIQATELTELVDLLDVTASDYWYHHYRFGVTSEPFAKKLGKDAIHSLVINAIIPFLFYFGRKQHQPILNDKALYWMEKCPPENNRIIRLFQEDGWYAAHSGHTQAQLHLKKEYCDFKKCVNCGIGQYLLHEYDKRH